MKYKYSKILPITVLALTFTLLVMLVLSTPVLADTYIGVSPTKGKIGSSVEVYGFGFTPGMAADIYFSSDAAEVGQLIGDPVTAYELVVETRVGELGTANVGEIDVYFLVPSLLNDGVTNVKKVRGGIYYLYLTPDESKHIIAAISFTVERFGEIILEPTSGVVGSELKISGTGFGTNEGFTIKYDGEEVMAKSGDNTTNSDGEFTVILLAPKSTAGVHKITITGRQSANQAEAEFTAKPRITISSNKGVAGDNITVTGDGFSSNVTYSISFGGIAVVSKGTPDSKGSFSVIFTPVPLSPGIYPIRVVDEAGNADKLDFTLAAASVTLNPATSKVGTEVQLTGIGFQANKSSIPVLFDDALVTTTTSDSYGRLSASFKVPEHATGSYKVKVSDGLNTAEASFSVSAQATITPATSQASPGHVGSELTVNGAGFTGSGTIVLTYDKKLITTTTVNSNGSFSITFKAPAGSAGEHTVLVSDGIYSQEFTFFMEAASPAAPKLLKPATGVKAKSEASLGWENVTDPSGVSYTFQLARASDFSPASMLLEKKGLTRPEYTLTTAEKLKSVSKKTPYYWRVKAIDGTASESQWSATGSFYVGFVLELSHQMIYIIIAGIIAAVVLFLAGFLLGRRTAPPIVS